MTIKRAIANIVHCISKTLIVLFYILLIVTGICSIVSLSLIAFSHGWKIGCLACLLPLGLVGLAIGLLSLRDWAERTREDHKP